MQNRSLLFIATMLVYIASCNEKRGAAEYLHFKFTNEWKNDSLGCLKQREKIVDSNMNELKTFIGTEEKTFVHNFGKPNGVKLMDKRKILFYFIECGRKPIPKGILKVDTFNQMNTEAIVLAVEIDEASIVKGLRMMLP